MALCLFGGHTYREAAALLDIPPMAAAELVTAALRATARTSGDAGAATA